MTLEYIVRIEKQTFAHQFSSNENDVVNAIVDKVPELSKLFESSSPGEFTTIGRERFIQLIQRFCEAAIAPQNRLVRYYVRDEPFPGVGYHFSESAERLEIGGEICTLEAMPNRCILRVGLDTLAPGLNYRTERDVSHLDKIETDTGRVVTILRKEISTENLIPFFEMVAKIAAATSSRHISVTVG